MKALLSTILGLTALLAGLVAVVSLIGGKYLLAVICAAGAYGGGRLLARPQDFAARATFALFCAGIWAWTAHQKITADDKTDEAATPAAPPADMSSFQAARELVHSENGVEYYLIFYKKTPAAIETVVERRGGGTSYAWREIRCRERSQRYLGSGDSLNEAMQSRPDPAATVPQTGSSAAATVDFACRRLAG